MSLETTETELLQAGHPPWWPINSVQTRMIVKIQHRWMQQLTVGRDDFPSLTKEIMMTDLSRPWYWSTVLTSTSLWPPHLRPSRNSFTCCLYGAITPMSALFTSAWNALVFFRICVYMIKQLYTHTTVQPDNGWKLQISPTTHVLGALDGSNPYWKCTKIFGLSASAIYHPMANDRGWPHPFWYTT